MKIDVARDFYAFPMGRYSPQDGEYTGQKFRETLLAPKLRLAMKSSPPEKLIVNIDGLKVFGSSFLEEAFGGLIREEKFLKSDVKRYLIIESNKKSKKFYADAIQKYVDEA